MSDPIIQVPKFRVFAILGLSLSILFRNIVPFGLIALFIMSPTYIYLYVSDPNPVLDDGFNSAAGITDIIDIILSYFVTAILVFGVFQSLRGQPVSIIESVTRGLWVILPVIGVVVIRGLIWAAFGGLMLGAMFAASGPAAIIVAVIVVILAIYVTCILWVIVPAAAVEGRVLSSFGRSIHLTKGNRWRVFGLLLMAGIISALVGMLAGFIGGAIGSYSSVILLTWAATAITTAFGAVVVTVAYYRLCLVKDGIDENQIAAVFD
ncbi:MAG: hypothetical protein QF767_06895 [Alphaproteobacteria bacterium]|nr:hypothetical protein [Alphaproteobacteria bacterium]